MPDALARCFQQAFAWDANGGETIEGSLGQSEWSQRGGEGGGGGFLRQFLSLSFCLFLLVRLLSVFFPDSRLGKMVVDKKPA